MNHRDQSASSSLHNGIKFRDRWTPLGAGRMGRAAWLPWGMVEGSAQVREVRGLMAFNIILGISRWCHPKWNFEPYDLRLKEGSRPKALAANKRSSRWTKHGVERARKWWLKQVYTLQSIRRRNGLKHGWNRARRGWNSMSPTRVPKCRLAIWLK